MLITMAHWLHCEWHTHFAHRKFDWWILAAVFQRPEKEQVSKAQKSQWELSAQMNQAPWKIPAVIKRFLGDAVHPC